MLGLLNVRKSPGMTSRDVVNQIQWLVQPAKAGHAGTLDPLAQGVLIVAVGAATRLIEYIQQMPKYYSATFRLGCRSDTDDVEGQVTCVEGVRPPEESAVREVLSSFVGEIRQRPPAYSAVKVQGQRAYALARRGESVNLAPRCVSVYALQLKRYAFPELEVEMVCGSGTYVRAIGRDAGERLGTGAIMTQLTRTAIGRFHVRESLELETLTGENLPQHLLPPLRALDDRPRVVLAPDEILRVRHGRSVARPGHGIEGFLAGIDVAEQLIAVMQPDGANHVRPVLVMPEKRGG